MQCKGFCNDRRGFVDPANVNFIFIHNVLEVHEPFYILTFTASEHTQGRGLKVSFVKIMNSALLHHSEFASVVKNAQNSTSIPPRVLRHGA